MAATTTTVTSTPFTDIGVINEVAGTPCTPGWSPPPGPSPGPGYTPPLDLYPADIAYSVRKLSSSYSGFCMEVQRVSDSATQDIGFDSDGLIDVDELAAFDDGTGLRLRTWYDQTGNGRHAQTTVAGDMSYIYSGTAVYEANEIPVVTPRGTSDGFYPITGTYSTAANNTVFAVLSAGWNGGSYLFARGAFGSSGLLMAGIQCPISGCTSGVDFGFGTTQYYRDGAYYGGTGTGLTRNDFAESAISSQRIYAVGFTQSGLNAINMGRAGNTSIYATQEFIVYFSDQLGTTPRQALEQNLNSYYQSSNLPDYTSGFLADYPDAVAAYSVRQLSNTAVKCMRVRRAVAPFDEKDIGFTAGGDLDEAAIVAFGGLDELRVSAWYDQSGQSNHATQINPNSQPQIYNGTAVITENGKPTIQFVAPSGTNRALGLRPLDYSPALTEGEMFTAVRWLGNTGTRGGWKISTQAQDMHFPYYGGSVYDNFGSTSRYSFAPSVTLNQLNVYNAVTTPTEWTARLNGNVETTSATNTVGFANGTLGGGIGMDHHFSEWILFASAKSTVERTAIETNIQTYYSIP